MITCHVRYVIDPYQIPAFESYSRQWIEVVTRMGGVHHGYFLPAEGANNIAMAMFTFPSLAAYESYRQQSMSDPECIAAFKLAEDKKFILNYERSFLRPVFGDRDR